MNKVQNALVIGISSIAFAIVAVGCSSQAGGTTDANTPTLATKPAPVAAPKSQGNKSVTIGTQKPTLAPGAGQQSVGSKAGGGGAPGGGGE